MSDWVEHEMFRVRCVEGPVLEFQVKPGADIDVAAMRAYFQLARDLLGDDTALGTIADLAEIRSASVEARRFTAEDPALLELSERLAIVVQHPVARVIGSVFIGLNRPPKPTRLFPSRAAAYDWIRSQR